MTLADALRNAVTAHAARLETSIEEVVARYAPGAPANWGSPLAHLEPEYATRGHPVWEEIAPRNGMPGFLSTEFHNPWLMDLHFLRLLYGIRMDIWHAAQDPSVPEVHADVPMRIISDARQAGGASKSEHKNRPCRAVDLQVYNAYERGVIGTAAVRCGLVRIGPYPGKDRRKEQGWPSQARDAAGFHLDASTANPSPRWWTRY